MNPMLERLQRKIAQHGLHGVVAAKWRADGYKVASMMDHSAFAAFGAKLYTKSAEYRRIMEGLAALEKLSGRRDPADLMIERGMAEALTPAMIKRLMGEEPTGDELALPAVQHGNEGTAISWAERVPEENK